MAHKVRKLLNIHQNCGGLLNAVANFCKVAEDRTQVTNGYSFYRGLLSDSNTMILLACDINGKFKLVRYSFDIVNKSLTYSNKVVHFTNDKDIVNAIEGILDNIDQIPSTHTLYFDFVTRGTSFKDVYLVEDRVGDNTTFITVGKDFHYEVSLNQAARISVGTALSPDWSEVCKSADILSKGSYDANKKDWVENTVNQLKSYGISVNNLMVNS